MTKVLVATDIHMPSPYLATILEGIKLVKPDALIISGDLSVDGKLGDIEKLFIKLKKANQKMRIIIVLGNHDLWIHEKDIDSISKIERINKLCEKYNVELLDAINRTELGDYDVVGNVGWYDYSFAPGYTDFDYENCNPYGFSKEYIKSNCIYLNTISQCSCPNWHNDCIYTKLESRSFAKINKEKIERNIRGRQTIIVTHHAPFKDLIKEHSFFNAYDGQELSNIIFNNIIFNSNKKIVYYIYGHLHGNSVAPKMTINGITFINAYTFQFKLKDYIQNALLNL
ncbi:metallophosphoesterase [Sulfolobus islandicus Y.N.15.51]|uniref:Metallophosphoesterase n=2 Tax=Saccharolobus islandicus TaxID=43080 RepID=C3NIU2_SACI1|nr:metallophosphoesterase [Sulfolobus islandicus]ACP49052.1 metallophosphoesterase [Sulfolobus islandicus Y.N.15.51]